MKDCIKYFTKYAGIYEKESENYNLCEVSFKNLFITFNFSPTFFFSYIRRSLQNRTSIPKG